MIHITAQRDFSQPGLLEQAARTVLKHQAVAGDPDLSIVLTDDDKLQELNNKYLGINAPTDVLAFPSTEKDPDTRKPYLGDILISLPRAEQQAREAGHPAQSEVQLLVVHGVLHLLGHDHAKPEDKAHMWHAQGEILKLLGLGSLKVGE
jgi:probable rRNA maturation factor